MGDIGHGRSGAGGGVGYDHGVSEDDALFGLADDIPASTPEESPAPIQTWQIDQIRNALDVTGITAMTERQTLIEEIVGRPVAALRELHFADVRRLLEELHTRKAPTVASTDSVWDQREGDTWIDRI